jgi:hypothetical protein
VFACGKIDHRLVQESLRHSANLLCLVRLMRFCRTAISLVNLLVGGQPADVVLECMPVSGGKSGGLG